MSSVFNKKIIHDFNRAARDYDNYASLQREVCGRLFAMMQEAHFALANSTKHENTTCSELKQGCILDVGAGTGYLQELLYQYQIYLPLVQADISLEMCKIAACSATLKKYNNIYTCAADMRLLPFADNSFMNIFSSMAMQWSENIGDVFLEAKRLLKNNGNFYFSVVGAGSLYELQDVYNITGYPSTIHNFVNKDIIKEKLIQAGLRPEELVCETKTMYYPNIHSLLRVIKNVGARYKGQPQGGFKSKRYFDELENIYKNRYDNSKGLPVSWNIIYIRGGHG